MQRIFDTVHVVEPYRGKPQTVAESWYCGEDVKKLTDLKKRLCNGFESKCYRCEVQCAFGRKWKAMGYEVPEERKTMSKYERCRAEHRCAWCLKVMPAEWEKACCAECAGKRKGGRRRMNAMEIETVKKALDICAHDYKKCFDSDCPYIDNENCQRDIARDALEAIEQLQADMEREVTIWHKWPDEKPMEYVSVLGHMSDMDKRLPQVRECYLTSTGKFCFPSLMGEYHEISEWAEMPTGGKEG